MNYNYTPFELEEWISVFYKNIGIIRPEDINEKEIANALGITLDYSDKPCFSYEDSFVKIINIRNTLPKSLQRERFFHELGHVLRHAGSQLIMPKSFIDLQEFDSRRFTKYAALPQHMILKYDLDSSYVATQLANDFKVSEFLAIERVENIKNKMFAQALLVSEGTTFY